MTRTGVVLFTRDLRVHDHPALAAARRECSRIVPLFVLDDRLLAVSPRRTALLLARLEQLREATGLVAVHGDLAAEPELEWRDLHPGRRVWRDDPEAAAAWKEGRTGVPFVDAAMRQLLAEGSMPNRQRLVAASYLTKELGIDWRIGAAHFAEHLVDGDVASNSGNWQWAAGTGADTRPNRRFNTARQARLHDPDGAYVGRWLGSTSACSPARFAARPR